MEITHVRKHQISHFFYHLIPNIYYFYCAWASHICKAVLFFSLSPPPSLLHMGLTYDPHTSNAIAWPDLWSTNQLHLESQTGREAMAQSCRWRSASQHISARKSPTPPPNSSSTFFVPWRHDCHSFVTRGTWSLVLYYMTRFRESCVFQCKKTRGLKKMHLT